MADGIGQARRSETSVWMSRMVRPSLSQLAGATSEDGRLMHFDSDAEMMPSCTGQVLIHSTENSARSYFSQPIQ